MNLILRQAWVVVLAVFAVSSCAPGGGGDSQSQFRQVRDRLASSEKPAVLFIGNSYTFGLPKAFARSMASAGRTVEVAQATKSGKSLGSHSRDASTLGLLRSRHWDVVVLQEASLIPADPLRRRISMLPAVGKLASEARQTGALPVLYQTWGRRDGNPAVRGDDFYRMNRRVREGYAMVSQKSGGLPVIPVGDAWEREFRVGRGGSLFLPDGSHPSPKGVKISAGTFCSTLMPEVQLGVTKKGGHVVRP